MTFSAGSQAWLGFDEPEEKIIRFGDAARNAGGAARHPRLQPGDRPGRGVRRRHGGDHPATLPRRRRRLCARLRSGLPAAHRPERARLRHRARLRQRLLPAERPRAAVSPPGLAGGRASGREPGPGTGRQGARRDDDLRRRLHPLAAQCRDLRRVAARPRHSGHVLHPDQIRARLQRRDHPQRRINRPSQASDGARHGARQPHGRPFQCLQGFPPGHGNRAVSQLPAGRDQPRRGTQRERSRRTPRQQVPDRIPGAAGAGDELPSRASLEPANPAPGARVHRLPLQLVGHRGQRALAPAGPPRLRPRRGSRDRASSSSRSPWRTSARP